MIKILVIEDDPQVIDNIQDILELENFETITAENGAMGIKKAQENKPDLIICDIMMSEIDGYGVLKQLRNDSKTKLIPLIFLTAKADKNDFRQGMELGADDYLTKPFSPSELIRAINSRLNKQDNIKANYIQQIENLAIELEKTSYYNNLTKLPNRLFLEEKLRELKGEKLALLIINLDQFGWIVSNFGHNFQDSFIKKFTTRMKNYCDHLSKDIGFFSHLEAEKFGLIINNFSSKEDLDDQIKTLLTYLSAPLKIDNKEILISISIGVALKQIDNENILDLIDNAAVAMYRSKAQGGNHQIYYTTEMKDEASLKLNIAAQLRYALEREEFELYYQPQINIKTGKIMGAEALLRWQNPELGFISPGQFIPIAEETGLIINIGEWVLKKACQQLKKWQEKYPNPLSISVNLSPRQFKQPNLTDKIIQIIEETGVAATLLDLELTETLLMDNVNLAIKILQDLKTMGIKVSIDDFGTGYSSLGYLQKFPFDILKIDRCFIKNINQNTANQAITKALISMSHDLNLKVIAEGIETREELRILMENNCDGFQGYLFSPPVPVAKFENLFSNSQ
jgi:diguanylate cyclase